MGIGRREGLRRACEEGGWSYAVFWKAVGGADPVHLIWEDGHCESKPCTSGSETPDTWCLDEVGNNVDDRVHDLVKKTMASQVHILGEGVIGHAALSGKYRWLSCDTIFDEAAGLKDAVSAEMNCQLVAGIKTIVVIPVLPHGVLQLGSTHMIRENPTLVLHAKRLCSHSNNRSSATMPRLTHGEPKKLDQSVSLPVGLLRKEDFRDSFIMSRQCGTQVDRRSVLPEVKLCSPTSADSTKGGTHVQPLAMGSGISERLMMVSKPIFDFGCSVSTNDDAKRGFLRSLKCYNADSGVQEDISTIKAVELKNDVMNSACTQRVCNLLRDKSSNSRKDALASQQMFGEILCASADSWRHQYPFPAKVPQAVPTVEVHDPENDQGRSFAAPPMFNMQVSCTNAIGSSHECSGLQLPIHASSLHTVTQNARNDNDGMLSHILGMQPLLQPSGVLGASVGHDLFDLLDRKNQWDHFNSILPSSGCVNHKSPDTNTARGLHNDKVPVFDACDELSYSGIFSSADADQLLDAVVSNVKSSIKQSSEDSASCRTSLTDGRTSCYPSSSELRDHEPADVSTLLKSDLPALSFFKEPSSSSQKEDPKSNGSQKSQIRLWIESGQNMNCDSASASTSKGSDVTNRPTRKRSRQGENPKPRPKDRQLIQDRIKELREIVPNGAKCSIDGLLEKTIKHMLFLQSVAKHADRLKEPTESKNFFEGGATWAFEVGSQSMTCPIIVEDLDRPGQMLVEMICEDRGIFLEIADFVKGLGLTILKGVMEVRKNKIWGRFTVEANREVTRMEIFLSLAHFLEPLCSNGGNAT